MNELERIEREDPREGVYGQTFADNQVILVACTSVKEIERKWMDTWEICQKWERRGKTVYNKAKTKAMFIEFGR